MAINGDDVCRKLEFKIKHGIKEFEEDLFDLKRAIDQGHEKAKLLMGLLGIQQDSEKIIITRLDEAREILLRMENNSVQISTIALNVHHSRTGQRMEMNGLDRQLAISSPLNESTNLRRFLKIFKIKKIAKKKNCRDR